MSRELNIPIDNPLHTDTPEDLVFRSPSTIPIKGFQELLDLSTIQGTNIAYYDISKTENQAIKSNANITLTSFLGSPVAGFTIEEQTTYMGAITDEPS